MYAMIIAGGVGERMRPLTDDRPKAMIPLAGRPLVEYQLEWLRRGGVTNVVMLCGYKAEVLKAHLGDGARFGLAVEYSIEDEPLGRGGALKRGFSLVPPDEETIIALNGDNVTEQSLPDLVAYHRRRNAVATVMLTPLRSPYGITSLDRAGRIVAFREKPLLPFWINAGIYVLSREFFAMLPDKGDHETTTFPELAEQRRLYGYRSRAFWRSMDTFKDVTETERELRELSRAG
jgi:NDP-sugar pyrophosphorylase family protein